MKNLSEIQYFFEHKDFDVRSDFINDYDFSDRYQSYYRNFIEKTKVKDPLYLSDLIDLSAWLGFYNIEIREKWFACLFKPQHYTVKLAALDYFKVCKKALLPSGYEDKLLNILSSGRVGKLLQNQILINLICLNSRRQILYTNTLIDSLSRTKDWRSIYRTLINLKELDCLARHKAVILSHIRRLHKERNFGAGVQILLRKIS
jgi:hypothetical protein